MINEWKDYYNNDYIIFSINNGVVNDQYYSTRHILNTYQSKVEFMIENIEDFSFKNEDIENSYDNNDFQINYAQQVLEVEDNYQKISQEKVIDQSIKNNYNSNKENEYLHSNEINDVNEINSKNDLANEKPKIKNSKDIKISDEFLKNEDYAIEKHGEKSNNPPNINRNIYEKSENVLKNQSEINKDDQENKLNKEYNLIEDSKENDKMDIIKKNKDGNILPLSRHDNNKKIDYNEMLHINDKKEDINYNTSNETNHNNSINEKHLQKDLKIIIDKNDSPKEDSKENNDVYERKKDNYKKLINNLKTQEQTNNNIKYYPLLDQRDKYELENKKMDKDRYLKDIPATEKIVKSDGNKLYSKDNDNENLQISNSLNSNNSQDYNNINSENNEIQDFEKYPKIYSRAQSYTTRSRDDEIKSLNDKLFSYKNQNKIILDENKKLLEIINIFKILQNLENSKKNNNNTNNGDSVNENLDSDGINREIENINKKKNFIVNKENTINNQNQELENNKDNIDFRYKEKNEVFIKNDLLNFEKLHFSKSDKNTISNLEFSNATKFLNTKNNLQDIGFSNLTQNQENISNKYYNVSDKNNLPDNFVNFQMNNKFNFRDEKNNKIENLPINNRYNFINDSSNQNLKNNLLSSVQISANEDLENEKIGNNVNLNLNNSDFQYNNLSNKNSNFNGNAYSNVYNNMSNSKINQNINISINSLNNVVSPSNIDLNRNSNKKKTFIKIDENFQNKGNYSKNIKTVMNLSKLSNKNNNQDKRLNNKVSYINTNSSPLTDSKVISNTINSNNITPNSKQFIFTEKQDAYQIFSSGSLNNGIYSNKDLHENQKFQKYETINHSSSVNNFNNEGKKSNTIILNHNDSSKLSDLNKQKNMTLNNKIPDNQNKSMVLNQSLEDKELKNYSNLIQYLEKYKELNDRLIETLENEKNDVKIDVKKRKRDVEYLEHILNYISSLGENKDVKDLIPFYLIDKRKLFENMVKYLYSKDEVNHSSKSKNVRLYKFHNKLK